MNRIIRCAVLSVAILQVCAGTQARGSLLSDVLLRPAVVSMYASPYACTQPAPPSMYPPVHIPNPFGRDDPSCALMPGIPGIRRESLLIGADPAASAAADGTPRRTARIRRRSATRREERSRRAAPIRARGRSSINCACCGVTQYIEEPKLRCKVSFWNQTGAELTLVVGDKTHACRRIGPSSWTCRATSPGRPRVSSKKREQVPSDLNYFDIVIRDRQARGRGFASPRGRRRGTPDPGDSQSLVPGLERHAHPIERMSEALHETPQGRRPGDGSESRQHRWPVVVCVVGTVRCMLPEAQAHLVVGIPQVLTHADTMTQVGRPDHKPLCGMTGRSLRCRRAAARFRGNAGRRQMPREVVRWDIGTSRPARGWRSGP